MVNISRTTQNSAFKYHPTDILRGENHLYGIVLVHIIHKIQQNTYCNRWPDIKFLKIAKNPNFSLTASLPDHSCKPKTQMKQRTVTILRHNNKLTSGMCFLGFRRVYALCVSSFLLSSIRLVVIFFKHRNHTGALIFRINTFL